MDLKGLSTEEVRQRSEDGRTNHNTAQKTKTYTEIIIENVFSLFNFITICIIIFVIIFYFINNDSRLLLDTLGIFFIALTNTAISLFQEIKSKKALDKVKLLLKKEITVIRDGKKEVIEDKDIVVDDIIEIIRGDQIVVDGSVVESRYLEIDESLLTGESLPISKSKGSEVLSGSFCVSGTGYYKAEKVGEDSHASKVTKLAKRYKFVLTPLQKRINLILKILFAIALILVSIEVLTYALSDVVEYSTTDHIRKIATILISLVPQGLVFTASITFAIGVYRISKIGAIIQKLNAIESFSNVEYVCMDKTGTLTENKLRVHSIENLSDFNEGELEKLLGTFYFHSTEKNATIRALRDFPKYENSIYLSEIPFNSSNKYSYLQLEIDNKKRGFVFGAYDLLLDKYNGVLKNDIIRKYNEKNLSIYRTLLFAEVKSEIDIRNKRLNDRTIFEPLCIVSITDTIRKDVYEAINLFETNGIKFKILTGDAPEAVKAIMSNIGWKIEDEEIITGNTLSQLDDENFFDTIIKKTLFARLKPEDKLRIIKSFRKNKKHTAMIGDGVNDLPAIKSADIGIAMEEGSTITKDVADIILLKNKFSLLPEIFNEGNKIVNTVDSIAKLFLTKNFIVIYISVLSLLSLMSFPLTPRRVSLLNVFSIGLPAFIITMKNNNIRKNKNFVKDVFSFVILSSTLMVLSNYLTQFIMQHYTTIPAVKTNMALMIVLIILAVMNFFIVASQSGSNKKLYYLYGSGLIIIFILLSGVNMDFYIVNILKTFYEIEYISFDAWIIIIILSFVFSVLLITLHYFRRKIFKLDEKN